MHKCPECGQPTHGNSEEFVLHKGCNSLLWALCEDCHENLRGASSSTSSDTTSTEDSISSI